MTNVLSLEGGGENRQAIIRLGISDSHASLTVSVSSFITAGLQEWGSDSLRPGGACQVGVTSLPQIKAVTIAQMSTFAQEVEDFVSELDAAVENHLEWTRRVLRCAVTRASPGDDVLAPDAHCRCRFGRWVTNQKERFKEVDEAATLRILDHHERMHAAIRRLCSSIIAGDTGSTSDLNQFESNQKKLIDDLARFKTKLLEHGARRDFLTGLPLRYGLEAEYDRFRLSARRFGKKIALILIDIDHFKRINDTYGHGVGDLALKHAAEILKRQARRGESIFRFGGEEFLHLAMVDTAIDAEGTAIRLVQAFRDTPLQMSERELLRVHVSAGLALAEHDEDMGQAVARADSALYSAKGAGRNCWRWAERPVHESVNRRPKKGADSLPEPPRQSRRLFGRPLRSRF